MFSSLCKQIIAQRKCEAENIIKTAEVKEYEYKDPVIAFFIDIWGKGGETVLQNSKNWNIWDISAKIVVLPCSVHYKNTFVTHKGEVKLQTKLCFSPLLLWCNLTWPIEPDMLY